MKRILIFLFLLFLLGACISSPKDMREKYNGWSKDNDAFCIYGMHWRLGVVLGNTYPGSLFFYSNDFPSPKQGCLIYDWPTPGGYICGGVVEIQELAEIEKCQ